MQEQTTCRMYENIYPMINEMVVVTVKETSEMGIIVELKEYDNLEAIITLPELSRKRIRSMKQLASIGKEMVVVVLRVDEIRNHIDVSRKRVRPDDDVVCLERYRKSKVVHNIMMSVASTGLIQLEELYQRFVWPISRKFGHAYNAFCVSLKHHDEIYESIDLDSNIVTHIQKAISKKLPASMVKIRADLSVSCYSYEGIDAIKASLKAGLAVGSVSIKLIKPPIYIVYGSFDDANFGIVKLNEAIKAINETINKYNGVMKIEHKPRVVNAQDEVNLNMMLEKLQIENMEVSGDLDEDC